MPDDLESRLEQAFVHLASPSHNVEQRALATALRVLPARAPRSRRRQVMLLLAAGVGVILLVTAGALAAGGRLRIGGADRPAPARHTTSVAAGDSRLLLPPGATGIAAVVDGRLWLTMRGGARIERLPVTTATLSPRALYVAAGIGKSLVVMAPDGRRAWIRPTGGKVVAVAWAPSGLRIAYVVAAGGRYALRTIEGNGRRDQLVDGAVAPVAPSWRADSLALAYAGAGGQAIVYDLAHTSRRVIVTGLCSGSIDKLAFAPTGRRLAAASKGAVYIDAGPGHAAGCVGLPGTVRGIAWSGENIVAAETPTRAGMIAGVVTFAVEPDSTLSNSYGDHVTDLVESGVAAAPIVALAAAGPARIATVLNTAGSTRLVLADPPPLWISYGDRRLRTHTSLLTMPGHARITAISIR